MKLDHRYTVRLEFTGSRKRQHVARFCGDWIGCAHDRRDALALCCAHRRAFLTLLA